MVVNVPSNLYNSNNDSTGYLLRRKSIDSNVPLITNIKCARLFIASSRDCIKNGVDYTYWDEYVVNN